MEEGLGEVCSDGQIGVEGSEDCKVAVRWREWRGSSRGNSTDRGSGINGLVVREQRHEDDTRTTRRGRAFEVVKTKDCQHVASQWYEVSTAKERSAGGSRNFMEGY